MNFKFTDFGFTFNIGVSYLGIFIRHQCVYSAEVRYNIGKFACENGSAAGAVRKFKTGFPNLNESTDRDFRKKYHELLKKEQPESVFVSRPEILTMRHGRLLILRAVDGKVQQFIRALRNRGFFVSRRYCHNHCEGAIRKMPTVGWARSRFLRIGYKRRAKTTDKVCIAKGAVKEAELLFLNDNVNLKESHDIPNSLVLNLDQTPSKLMQSSRCAPWQTEEVKEFHLLLAQMTKELQLLLLRYRDIFFPSS